MSVVQRPPGAPPGGGMALNEAGGTPPGWYGAAYATVGTGCCTTSPWTTGSFSASEGLSVPSGPVGHGGPGSRNISSRARSSSPPRSPALSSRNRAPACLRGAPPGATGPRTSTAASSPGSSASSAAGASFAAPATRAKSTTRPTARRSWPAARRRGSSSRCANSPPRRHRGGAASSAGRADGVERRRRRRRPLSSKVDKLT